MKVEVKNFGESGKKWKGVSPYPSPPIGHQTLEPSIGH
jgi:hypothetical protein